MGKATNLDQEEAYYLPELPPGSDDEPYTIDLVASEFTAKPFTLDD
jgi:hypothetical protein